MHPSLLTTGVVFGLLFSACSSDDASPASGGADRSTGTTTDVEGSVPSTTESGEPLATDSNGDTPEATEPDDTAASESSSMAAAPDDGAGDGAAAAGDRPEAVDEDIDLADTGAEELEAGGGGSDAEDGDAPEPVDVPVETVPAADLDPMSFFVTSRGTGTGGDFGGIAGADAFCTTLASESSLNVGGKTWRAYLSTSTENARDRIGAGPWRNFNGIVIANDLEQLHDQGANGALNETWPTNDATIALDEQGNQVVSDPLVHDIITGTETDGTVAAAGTCSDWTSETGTTQNGHSDRRGGGAAPESWAASHGTGCGRPTPGMNFQGGTVSQGGGQGSIYCFAID